MARSESTSPDAPRGAGLTSRAHDGCGVALVARLDAAPARDTVTRALVALENLEHRGAAGADPLTGDGAGIMVCMPDRFLRGAAGLQLPPPGRYAAGICFLPGDAADRALAEEAVERAAEGHGLEPVGWRDVPVDEACLGRLAAASLPVIRQVFLAAGPDVGDVDDLERRAQVSRMLAERAAGAGLVICGLSARTLVYKGLLSAPQLATFYEDLSDERLESPMALVHSRFSTNTLPSWSLAHPYRMLAHNGEINTLRGNVNWMRARERSLAARLDPDAPESLLPLVPRDASDSATFDATLELLVHAGWSLPHALAMMMPVAWEGDRGLDEDLAGFYAYHGAIMEPWDGPALIVASDGRVVAARLDRNGLRPARWSTTRDGWLVLCSETGALELDPRDVDRRGRLGPGGMLVVDLERGGLEVDGEAERHLAAAEPYGRWHAERVQQVPALPEPADGGTAAAPVSRHELRLAFGYTEEELAVVLAVMGARGKEPDASMGDDAALAVLSDAAPLLPRYFKQLFAQVTNPAIDPLREQIVMSLDTLLGRRGGDVGPDVRVRAALLACPSPILRAGSLERIRRAAHPELRSVTLDMTWPVADGAGGLAAAVDRLRADARRAVAADATILVLTDRAIDRDHVPIPALLACSAVHHELVACSARLDASIVVDSGEPREVHHVACLLGFGADAIHPWLLLDTLPDLLRRGEIPGGTADEAEQATLRALDKGLLKVMSKLGIATVSSYRGAQAFEAVGLAGELVDRHFPGTPSRIGGVGLRELGEEALARHARAWPPWSSVLPPGGVYAWRAGGERHAWNPRTLSSLREAVRNGSGGDRADPSRWAEYRDAVAEDARRGLTLRGLLALRSAGEPVGVEEVEPAADVVRRFATGAMSLGSISPEAHETLAIAMNRLGGRSNTGEGGEDARRFTPDPSGDSRRSAIKQVASARFGVTIDYLVNADQLQIKISQGSKPGEGGQLPGHKVDENIGRLRFATPGVELISPPPHHDIYSIEDLKQLIHDLRCSNPRASVSVKLAAEYGVGTVAAGVVKAGADHVTIAGHDGGTGASPLSSVVSAGVPWELGLAETQQILVENDLREGVTVQVDGQLKTGRDVVVGAMLGADEFGFSTAPLVATGCIMMRVCHLNTCPVGIATQDPRLRERFEGTPEHVTRFFVTLAEDVRAILASLGVQRLADVVGRADLLVPDVPAGHTKARTIDFGALLAVPRGPQRDASRADRALPGVGESLDQELVEAARPALEEGRPVRISRRIRNVHRTVGGLLSSEVARLRGADGLPEGTISLELEGAGGQSFGAWLAPGVTITLTGDANDYAGKGLSGGVLVVRPPAEAAFDLETAVIAGNTVLYGATSGRAFLRGVAGERFAVRNSGVQAVVEGVGDHGCEYMTGGRVLVLGPTGRNFAAGMSGGLAYVLDDDGAFRSRCNLELVDLEEPDAEDELAIAALLREHADRTGSSRAQAVLDEWPRSVGRFTKVIPRAYREVMARRAAERDGRVIKHERVVVA
jgi:glutamate synthase (NADPH) large chain